MRLNVFEVQEIVCNKTKDSNIRMCLIHAMNQCKTKEEQLKLFNLL